MKPIYDICKTYHENVKEGPFFSDEMPKRIHVNPRDFLGFTINSPIGVPAGPLLNSKWIALAANLGFDVLTYKTIRSSFHPGHPLPNVVYVTRQENQAQTIDMPNSLEDLSITNSFGMPSMSADFLMEDIHRANSLLNPGQIMIVSIVGSTDKGLRLLDDFVKTAQIAKDAGAKIIEANFSCPNVKTTEGSLYTCAETVFEFSKKIAHAIHPIPLLIKIGDLSSKEALRRVCLSAARAGCRGIAGLNSISMEIVNQNGAFALGSSRKTGGICGSAIRKDALKFMENATAIRREEKLDLVLLGCGGLMIPDHLSWMLDAGADIAMSATAMMWDPYLAIKFQRKTNAVACH